MIPTITARTPSRINEVDDDLSVDVDLGMTGVPFVGPGLTSASLDVHGVPRLVDTAMHHGSISAANTHRASGEPTLPAMMRRHGIRLLRRFTLSHRDRSRVLKLAPTCPGQGCLSAARRVG